MTDEDRSEGTPVQLPIAPGAIRTVALAELDRTDAFVRSVSLQDWTKSSASAEWSIGDVVAHLALTLGLYGRLLDAALSGRSAGGLWKAVGQVGKRVAPAASPALNRLNKAVPRLMDRALAPEVIKGQFSAGARSLRGKIERVGSGDYMRPVYYLGAPWPLSFFLASVVDELGLHGWDMASVLDPTARLSEEARSVIPWFFWSGTPFLLRLPKGTSGAVQVVLDDPPAEMWWQLAGPQPRQGAGRTMRPDATITGPSGIYSLVISGRIPLTDALRSPSLHLEGNDQLARAFLGAWRLV